MSQLRVILLKPLSDLKRKFTYLQVAGDQRHELEVMVVFTERVDEGLGHLQPADVEEKLQERKYRHIKVDDIVWVILRRVKKLLTQNREQEEGVHSDRYHLPGGNNVLLFYESEVSW